MVPLPQLADAALSIREPILETIRLLLSLRHQPLGRLCLLRVVGDDVRRLCFSAWVSLSFGVRGLRSRFRRAWTLDLRSASEEDCAPRKGEDTQQDKERRSAAHKVYY